MNLRAASSNVIISKQEIRFNISLLHLCRNYRTKMLKRQTTMIVRNW